MWKRLCSACLVAGLLQSASIAAPVSYLGNLNTGFGGPVGNGTLVLDQVGTSSTINGTFTKGAGDFNDALVIYIDSAAGGFTSTSTFDDNADGLRTALSGFNGTDRTTVNFSPGFDADYGMAIDTNFGGLWSLAGTGSHPFQTGLGTSFANTDPSFTFSFNLGDLGLAPGDSFDFVGTYISTTAFRSDEAIGDGVTPGNPGNSNPISFSVSRTFTTSAVPEPSSFALMLVGAGAATFYRRRKA